MRDSNRRKGDLRPVTIERGIQPQAAGSVLIKMGNTQIICGVSIEQKVPPFLKDRGQGWITAEYGILPCATNTRYRRETSGQSGRSLEIQRLIGRSLRMMVDLKTLGEHTLRVDCDVLNADGGTRTASITGGALALRDALEKMVHGGMIKDLPDLNPVVAISAGIVGGEPLLDLDYKEDSSADVDGNFVMSEDGRWIEIQSTAEKNAYEEEAFLAMLRLAGKGCRELLSLWG